MSGARIGSDCNVGDHAFIESGAVIGDRVTVKNNALIWNGVSIEDEVFIGPNAVFTNDLNPRAGIKRSPEEYLVSTSVRRGATIGANATLLCGITIGSHAFVGAGAVVVSDVVAHALMLGNPARRVGWACECGLRLPDGLLCSCGRAYRESGPTLVLVT
jgi:acetyltransferase-like isoleucine patch superfamily enzyme